MERVGYPEHVKYTLTRGHLAAPSPLKGRGVVGENGGLLHGVKTACLVSRGIRTRSAWECVSLWE